MLTPKGGIGSKQSSPVTFPVNRIGSANGDVYHTVGDKDMVTQFMLTKGQWDLMLVLPPANVLLVRLVITKVLPITVTFLIGRKHTLNF